MAFSTHIGVRAISSSALRQAIQKVLVIGGGQMGSGIAQVAASTGHNVTLVDVSEDVLKKSQQSIQKSLKRVAQKQYKDPNEAQNFISATLENLSVSTDVNLAVKNCDLVVEAIVEKLEIKQELFKSLDKSAPPDTIFTSNTSSYFIRDLAKQTNRPDRFGGLHFFNPVPVLKLVEIVATPETSPSTLTTITEFSKTMGKTPVQAKDTPGFIVNRLFVPFLMEAAKMLERGDATKEDIDTAIKLGIGHPMGPIELMDFIGIDTVVFAYEGWKKVYPDWQLFDPSEMVTKMVRDGKVGAKAGQGFYAHKK